MRYRLGMLALVLSALPATAGDIGAEISNAAEVLSFQDGYYGTKDEALKTITDAKFIAPGQRSIACENRAGPFWQFHVVAPDPDDRSKKIDGFLGINEARDVVCVTIPFID